MKRLLVASIFYFSALPLSSTEPFGFMSASVLYELPRALMICLELHSSRWRNY